MTISRLLPVVWIGLTACNEPAANPAPTSTPPTATSASPKASAATAAPDAKPIGMAKLEDDGTLVVTLYTQGSIKGQTQRKIAKDDPEHAEYVKHIGGIEPGEEKPVPPWPDDIDDAKVNEAVKKHLAREAWAKGAKIEITGTDADKRIAVTVWSAKPPKKGLSLRLDPKSYAVVESKAIPTQ